MTLRRVSELRECRQTATRTGNAASVTALGVYEHDGKQARRVVCVCFNQ